MGQGGRKTDRGAGAYAARKYAARNGYPPRNGREFDRERRAARKKRRRRRLMKGLAAWAVCLALVALIAFGVTRFVGYLGTSKQRSLRAQGIEAVQTGSYQEAIDLLNQALEASGNGKSALTVDILRWRAEAEYQLQDYEAASHTYQLLMEQDPDCLEYWYMAAICDSALGNADQALNWYHYVQEAEQDGRKKAAGREKALAAVGEACAKAGKYEEALGLYQDAIGDGLDNEELYNQMGLCQMAGESYEDAADSFDQGKIKAQESGNQELLRELSYNQAVCSEYLGRYQEALEQFQAYEQQYGSDEEIEHEIEFLESRVE